MMDLSDLYKVWALCMAVSVCKTGFLAQRVGGLRGKHKSFATAEDKKGLGGDANAGAVTNGAAAIDHPEIMRWNNCHRNELENIPLFIGGSTVFVVVASAIWGQSLSPSNHDCVAGAILFVVWTASRLGHTICYLNELSPARTIVFVLGLVTSYVIPLYAMINAFANLSCAYPATSC